MCRSHSEPCGPRRCKNTEEERIAKANYRARKKLQTAYSGSLSSKTVPAEPQPQLSQEASPQERIAELISIVNEPQGDTPDSEYDLKLSAAYVQIGEIVSEHMSSSEDRLAALVEHEKTQKEVLERRMDEARSLLERTRQQEEDTQADVYAITGVNRETYPIMSEREAVLKEQHPEQWQRLVDAEEASEKANDDYMQAIRDRNHASIAESLHGGSPEWLAALEARREAYRETMAAFGVELADDMQVSADSASNRKAVAALNGVMQFFPKGWVEESNSQEKPMVVKMTKGRAHYSSAAPQRVSSPKLKTEARPNGWEPSQENPEYSAAVKLTDEHLQADGTYSYLEEVSGRTYSIRNRDASQDLWLVPEYKTYEKRTREGTVSYEPAKKEGWEAYEVDGYDYSVSPPQKRVHTRWRKMETRSLLSVNNTKSELTVSGDTPLETSRVASHEFCHRTEHVVSGVARAEQAFLAYRSKQHTDSPEKLETIQAGEVGYKDSFATHYAGRVYDGKSFEVFSVGMEMLLYGSNGGFHGKGSYREDTEHQNFILGLIASTAKK